MKRNQKVTATSIVLFHSLTAKDQCFSPGSRTDEYDCYNGGFRNLRANNFLGDQAIDTLVEAIRGHMSVMFKICEAVGLLDMIVAFAQLVTVHDYTRPQLTDTLAIKSGRHPIKEKIMHNKFVPNDVYATQQTRFQIITGCNMSGKSTYIRTVALMSIMAQIGCL